MRYSAGQFSTVLSLRSQQAALSTSSENPVPILQMVSYCSMSLLQMASKYDPQYPVRFPVPQNAPIGTTSRVSPSPLMQSFLSFTHYHDRLEQVYTESKSLIMRPSVPNLMASCRNSSIDQKSSSSLCSLSRTMLLKMVSILSRYQRRYLRGRCVMGSLQCRISKANRLTCTSSQCTLQDFLARVDSTWKGSSCLVFRLMATISQSRIKDFSPAVLMPSTFLLISRMMSVQAAVRFSRFRENIQILPQLQCTCPRSPSYLYSHVSCLPSNLFRMSPMPRVGLANMGLHGMPKVSLHFYDSLWKSPFSYTKQRMISASLGYSAVDFFITCSYSTKFYQVCYLTGISYSNRALISAFCMVFSPAAIFKFPSTHRTMYLVYSLLDCSSKFIRMFSFSVLELLPLVLAIFLRLLNTFSMVRGYLAFFLVKNDSMLFWLDLQLWATSPKSPTCMFFSLICFSLMPQLLEMAFMRIYLPMPSSFFSQSGPIFSMDSQQPLTKSSGDYLTRVLNRLDSNPFWTFLEFQPLQLPTFSYVDASSPNYSLLLAFSECYVGELLIFSEYTVYLSILCSQERQILIYNQCQYIVYGINRKINYDKNCVTSVTSSWWAMCSGQCTSSRIRTSTWMWPSTSWSLGRLSWRNDCYCCRGSHLCVSSQSTPLSGRSISPGPTEQRGQP